MNNKLHNLPITEKDISKWTNYPVYAPIYCASLKELDINTTDFIDFYKTCFKTMPWDYYDVKRKQWEAIPANLKDDKQAIFKKYYTKPDFSFEKFVEHFELDEATKKSLHQILPWRRRSVCNFEIYFNNEIEIKRIATENFKQQLEATDIRALPRVFEETNSYLVENNLFFELLKKIAIHAQNVTPHVEIKQLKISAHFMSVKARKAIPGNNSPEGAHEDGSDFIVSALVINRKNIEGAKSQVIEKMPNGEMATIFEHILQPGEFLFQADTGEEKHYGNDLWHYVTPFHIQNENEEAWRDIIGLDIAIVQPKI